jgi:GNAT superfamily N-acetyltransferase
MGDWMDLGDCNSPRVRIEFATIAGQRPGLIAELLGLSYAELVESDSLWIPEREKWEEFDRDVFDHPDTVGACVFLTKVGGRIAGFGSWDPRPAPEYVIIGHNCILPEFRGRGLGRKQIEEILRRFRGLGARTAIVSTNDSPFFIPAQCMYISCGFREVGRTPWEPDPTQSIIEYEMDIGP